MARLTCEWHPLRDRSIRGGPKESSCFRDIRTCLPQASRKPHTTRARRGPSPQTFPRLRNLITRTRRSCRCPYQQTIAMRRDHGCSRASGLRPGMRVPLCLMNPSGCTRMCIGPPRGRGSRKAIAPRGSGSRPALASALRARFLAHGPRWRTEQATAPYQQQTHFVNCLNKDFCDCTFAQPLYEVPRAGGEANAAVLTCVDRSYRGLFQERRIVQVIFCHRAAAPPRRRGVEADSAVAVSRAAVDPC